VIAGLPRAEPRKDQPGRGAGRGLAAAQVLDVGFERVRPLKLLRLRVRAVALLRDRQRHDLHPRVRERRRRRRRVVAGEQEVREVAADDAALGGRGAARPHRVEPALLREGLQERPVERKQPDPADAPPQIALAENGVGKHGLVRAVKRADANMNDASLKIGTFW